VYGRIRQELEQSGFPTGPLDMLIAAPTLSEGTTLVTDNVREFQHVNGLKIENWLRS